jgi:LPXTG-motif cell wall-anchored protein
MHMKTMKWTQRILIGTGLAVTSLFAVPTVAGAVGTTCYVGCTPPNVSPSSVPVAPTSDGGAHVAATSTLANGSSSLPFTGADIGELAAVGAGAVVIGGVLARRRRRAA